MTTVDEYRVVARNTATASANKIHDDAVARRRYGFAGGLVPGVDVYAYMTHPPAAWGLDWLERGSMRRFLAGVRGEEVVVVAGEVGPSPAGHRMALELRGPGGTVRASGEALPEDTVPPRPGGDWAAVDQADDPPEASPTSLAAGTAFALAAHGFHADNAAEYLAEIGESLPLYADHGVAHLAGCCATPTRCCRPTCGWGRGSTSSPSSSIRTRPRRRRRPPRHGHTGVGAQGHRFVELDVGLLTGGDRWSRRSSTRRSTVRPKGG